jgi:hypothetical protein
MREDERCGREGEGKGNADEGFICRKMRGVGERCGRGGEGER